VGSALSSDRTGGELHTIWDGDEDVLDLNILFGEKIYKPEK